MVELRASLRAVLSSAAVLVATVGGCGDDAGAGPWEFKVDTMPSPADGGTRMTSWLRTVGKEGAEGEARTKGVIFSFDCFKGTASSTIMTEQALRQGSVETRVKVDADSPRVVPGFAGTTASGGQVVITIPQDSMLALLSGRQVATIEYADGAGSSRTVAEFPVAGLEKYSADFRAACARRGKE